MVVLLKWGPGPVGGGEGKCRVIKEKELFLSRLPLSSRQLPLKGGREGKKYGDEKEKRKVRDM